VEAAAKAFTENRPALLAEVSSLERTVANKDWTSATIASNGLSTRLEPLRESELSKSPDLTEITSRLEAQKKLIDRHDAAVRAEKRKQDEAAEAILTKASRQAYAKVLREKFLDMRMDVEVSVSGKNSERLYLKYALFNAVWAHDFEKGDLISGFRKLGFKRVDLTDGWQYHVYYDL
jgi:N-acetylglucosamine kinase-like BadF-type ATPase